jgi:YVTN family beta-propeller protein
MTTMLAAALLAAPAHARDVFVANGGSSSVSVIDTGTDQVVGQPIAVGLGPFGVAVTPDARTAYVTNIDVGQVHALDTSTKQVVGAPILVGGGPYGIAVTPDGTRAYTATNGQEAVAVIDTGTNFVGPPIPVVGEPGGIAITPDGSRAYVASIDSGTISVIDTGTNQVVGQPIPVGEEPKAIAITPDGGRAYVVNHDSSDLSVVDTLVNQVVGAPIDVGSAPEAIAITPDQAPVASFFATRRARPGVPVAFNAAASSDPDGSLARYDWAFGDGQAAPNDGPTPSRAYPRPGTYQATLTVTDNDGCSTTLIFTGQTAYCNGSPSASQTQTLKVAYPGIRVKCPRRARRRGCRFKLRAVTKRRKGKAETRAARAKVKAGKSKIISLKPKQKFRSKLARAKKVLVRQTVVIRGHRRTRFRRLKVVQ